MWIKGTVEVVALVAQIIGAATDQDTLVESTVSSVTFMRVSLNVAGVSLLATSSQHSASVFPTVKGHTGIALVRLVKTIR